MGGHRMTSSTGVSNRRSELKTAWKFGVRHGKSYWTATGSVDTHLIQPSLSFELNTAEIPRCRMPAFGVAEALNIIEHSALASDLDRYVLRSVRPVFSEEKKLPIAAQLKQISLRQSWGGPSLWNEPAAFKRRPAGSRYTAGTTRALL